ncbi:hypothetical protein BRADI_5g19853v3 [Brachypodium distachyon]|uniref:Uncharacterized protein n=1 Tax=Brachypodium distachyon TaxID=15368 RepID=A0A2K2CI77_BRADI|nr:hypothetical protein BRADI_5g19853v3 [Brachypodium distachyon]
MAGIPDESAGQSQARRCSSYIHSFPSEPPDIRNWFSSYEYESPEDSELVADPGDGNGSETQDPLEYRVPGHSLPKHSRQDGGTALSGDCSVAQSEHEVSAARDFLPISRSMVERGAKRKQSPRELLGASFLDDHDKATESETLTVSNVHINAVEHLSNCNAVSERSHEGAVGYTELPAECDGISSAETQENPPGGQETKHIRLPVNCGSTSLAADTEEGFLEDVTEQTEVPANSNCNVLDDTEKTGIKHRIPPVKSNGIVSVVTKESSPVDGINCGKPTLVHQKAEETASGNGFITIRKKVELAERCRAAKIPKSSKENEAATLQENHCHILGQNVSARDRTRNPLSDRTNVSEVAGAPALEPSGRWKCPRRGKPYVGPPLKQLRLEQWVRRMN